MSLFSVESEKSGSNEEPLPDLSGSRPHKGAIVFCERKLCYEKGIKAWIFLGPYLLGAIYLEPLVRSSRENGAAIIWMWIGFFAYLILFPSLWRWFLRRVRNSRNPKIDLPLRQGSRQRQIKYVQHLI